MVIKYWCNEFFKISVFSVKYEVSSSTKGGSEDSVWEEERDSWNNLRGRFNKKSSKGDE